MRPKEERLDAIDGEGNRTVIFRITPRVEQRVGGKVIIADGEPTYLMSGGEKLTVREDGSFIGLYSRKRFRLYDPTRDF